MGKVTSKHKFSIIGCLFVTIRSLQMNKLKFWRTILKPEWTGKSPLSPQQSFFFFFFLCVGYGSVTLINKVALKVVSVTTNNLWSWIGWISLGSPDQMATDFFCFSFGLNKHRDNLFSPQSVKPSWLLHLQGLRIINPSSTKPMGDGIRFPLLYAVSIICRIKWNGISILLGS